MLGFHAEADPQPVQVGEELQDARWFTREEILEAQAREADPARDDGTGLLVSPRLSIARWLIDLWVEGVR
jgi:NAD+ diphosphatase